MTDPQRFIIVCPARSGSTMLVHLLRSHPDCLSNSEVMALTDSVGGFASEARPHVESLGTTSELVAWRRKDPIDFMEQVAFHDAGRPWAGFKIKSDELVLRKYRSILDTLRADTDIHVIHLNRANLMERYMSWVMVNKQTGVTLATREEDRPNFEPMVISPKKAERDFVVAEERQALLDSWFADHPMLNVDYDDLIRDPEAQSYRLCRFLGIEARLLTTRTIKIAPHVSTLVANWDEVMNYFAGTRFEHLFEMPSHDDRASVREIPQATVESLDPDAYRVPGSLRAPNEEWGPGGASYSSYVAAACDVRDLSSSRILAVGDHTDALEGLARDWFSVEAYVGLEENDDLIDHVRNDPPHPTVGLVPFDPATLRDDTQWLLAERFDIVVVRSRPEHASECRLGPLVRGVRRVAADGARLLISVPLIRSSTGGSSLYDRLDVAARPSPGTECAEVEVDGEMVTMWELDRVVGLLSDAGWRVDEVREPRRTFDFHLVCTAV